MILLAEIYKMMKKMEMPKLHDHNFVAKHAKRAGAGVHVDKIGKHAPRHKQKRE